MKFLISYYLFLKKICLKYNKKYLIHLKDNCDFNIENNDKGEIQLIKNPIENKYKNIKYNICIIMINKQKIIYIKWKSTKTKNQHTLLK